MKYASPSYCSVASLSRSAETSSVSTGLRGTPAGMWTVSLWCASGMVKELQHLGFAANQKASPVTTLLAGRAVNFPASRCKQLVAAS